MIRGRFFSTSNIRTEADVRRWAVGTTLVSVTMSLLITGICVLLLAALYPDPRLSVGHAQLISLGIAFVVPLIVSPSVAWALLVTLRRLNVARTELDALARTDLLTGLLNRRGFRDAAEARIAQARVDGAPVALLVADIDRFKAINDQHGHAGGDSVIRHVAAILSRHAADKSGIVARHGGEEYAVLLTGLPIRAAGSLADAMRAACVDNPLAFEGSAISATVSIGYAMALPEEADLDDLVRRADKALYQAKNTGRNRVVAGQEAAEAA